MRLREIYANQQPALSIEFFPPRTPHGEEVLAARIPALKALEPAFCSITCTNERSKTLWWSKRAAPDFGLDVMTHLTCIGISRDDIRAELEELRDAGIESIIALRGDPPRGQAEWQPHPQGFTHAAELVRAASAAGFSVAVAGFPEVHPEAADAESDIRFLREKVDAGADAIITQLFFGNDDFYRYLDRVRAAGITVPIVPGILPFRAVAQLRRFTTELARTKTGPARIPPTLEARLAAVEQDDEAAFQLGIEWATAQCEDLLRNGVAGIHFYCLNESRGVEAILKNLGHPSA